jgi:Protein of unknown function (DUF1566)
MKRHIIALAHMAIVTAAALFAAAPATSATPLINDTGQANCYATSNPFQPLSNCTGSGQDGEYGRDFTNPNSGDGGYGFSFVKVCNSGFDRGVGTCQSPLPAPGPGLNDWACTRDNVTGLLWEVKTISNAADTFSYAGDFPGAGLIGTDNLVASANAAVLCGATNWRLPSYNELMTLAHYGISSPPRIDHNFFPNTPTDGIANWTTTTSTFDGTYKLTIGFGTGSDGFGPAVSAHHARLVSGIPLASVTRFTPISSGTGLKDPLTGLVWRRCPEGSSWTGTECVGTPTMTNWAGALNVAAAAGGTWRLPSIAELSTLLRDTGAHTGCIMLPDVFPSATPIWSNTPFVGGVGPSGGAWVFESGYGTCYTRQVQPISSMGSVRLVRSY